jgi:glycosyltransferase involved in cell wall biosynthesis
MKLTLIITTYNWPESLFLVFESIRYQTIRPYEIIIADDGSDSNTRKLIDSYNKEFNLNIIHSWQPDKGFRVARSRNLAISKSSGDYIVLIDGDSILHHDFVKDHLDCKEPGCFIQGSRVMLSEKETQKALYQKNINFTFFSFSLFNRKNALHSQLLSKIFSFKKNHIHGIKSCNMSFYKIDCENINGFNNDFEGWGREDSEFVARLINNGIKRKNIRFRAIQFHLWHNEYSRKSLNRNDVILERTIKNQLRWCSNGITSIKNNES